MSTEHAIAMQKFYMNYVGPAFVIKKEDTVRLSEMIGANVTLELNQDYDLMLVIENKIVVQFSMATAGNKVLVRSPSKPLDLHENFVLAVMIILRGFITSSLDTDPDRNTSLNIFHDVVALIREGKI